jgi:hypothetical protein
VLGIKRLAFGSMLGGFVFLFFIGLVFTAVNYYVYYIEQPNLNLKNQFIVKINNTNQSN